MRVIVVGYGVQGHKRARVAAAACVGIVDPLNPDATYKTVEDVPLQLYDAALVCTPDAAKYSVLCFLLGNNKHVLVEKPLLSHCNSELEALKQLAARHSVSLYTAYNHRFEPHFQAMHKLLLSQQLGRLYTVRLFYGNGTARLVRESAWRDRGGGIIPDLGSHLLDTVLYWLDKPDKICRLHEVNCFENQAPDQCSFGFTGSLSIHLEMSLLSWRNHFYADVVGEHGSAHIQSLCKWGPATMTVRTRALPSGRPDETSTTLVQDDPTWELEWLHFQKLCAQGVSNIDNDIWINTQLNSLMAQAAVHDCSGELGVK